MPNGISVLGRDGELREEDSISEETNRDKHAKRQSCSVCGSADTEFFCKAFDRFRGKDGPFWDIYRCRRCGLGWTEPPPPEAEIGQHYPETYLGETAMMISEFKAGLLEGTRSWRREEEKVAVVERFCQGGRLLDVGCAEGKFLWALDSERWQPCGVEVDSKVVRLARTEFPQIEYVAGDIFSSDLTRHAFDVVTFWHSFEHLYHPRRVLSQLVEIIRPNGVIFISLPNFASLQASWFRRHWFQFDVPRHIYHFSPRSLEILLQEAGLKIEAHLFFSKLVNMHSWKHSALSFFEDWSGSRLPYYLTKPILLAMPLVEWFTGRPGTITTVARKKK